MAFKNVSHKRFSQILLSLTRMIIITCSLISYTRKDNNIFSSFTRCDRINKLITFCQKVVIGKLRFNKLNLSKEAAKKLKKDKKKLKSDQKSHIWHSTAFRRKKQKHGSENHWWRWIVCWQQHAMKVVGRSWALSTLERTHAGSHARTNVKNLP